MTDSHREGFGAPSEHSRQAESDRHREAVGTVADEAAKLLAAAQTWTRDHLRDEAPPCRYCPICSAIGFLRSTSPDVMEHLEAAGLSLVAALRAVADQHVSQADRPRPAATVDKIDLSEDPAWD
jgi:hypothetical protein